jgi:hypothetical protein
MGKARRLPGPCGLSASHNHEKPTPHQETECNAMAKFCEVCKNSYPDDQELCPHCGAEQVALVEGDSPEGEDFLPEDAGPGGLLPTEPTINLGRSGPAKDTQHREPLPTEHPDEAFDELVAEPAEDSGIEIGEDAIVLDDETPAEEDVVVEDSSVTLGEPGVADESDVEAGSALILGEDSGTGSGIDSDIVVGDSGIELVEEQIADESVPLGAESGPDRIAEAVESGIDLDDVGPAGEGEVPSSVEMGTPRDAPSSVEIGTPPTTHLASPEEMEEALEEPGRSPTQMAGPGEMEEALGGVTEETIHLGQEVERSSDSEVGLGEEGARDEAAAGINLDRMVEEEGVIEEEAEITGEEVADEEVAGEIVEEEEERPARPAPKPRSRVPAFVLGGLLGVLGGAVAGAGLLQFLPSNIQGLVGLGDTNKPLKPRPGPTPGPGPGTAPQGAPTQAELVEAGKFKDALARLENVAPNQPDQLALRGQARWRAAMQEKLSNGQRPQANDPEVKQALADLQAAAQAGNPDAYFWLGHLQAATGQFQQARATFTQGAQKFKERRFQGALDRLDLLAPPAGGMSFLDRDREALLAWLVIAYQPPPGPPAGQPTPAAPKPIEEAGYDFFAALKQARQGKYSEAITLLRAARDRHNRRRFRHLGQQQNPFSDPDEEIFLHAAALLEYHWQLQQKILSRAAGLELASKTDPAKAIDELAQAAMVGKANTETLTAIVAKLGGPKAITSSKDLTTAIDNLLVERQALAAAAKKLQDARVISEPKNLDKGIDIVLADSRALGAAEDKLRAAKMLGENEKLDAGLDRLLAGQKTLTAVADRLKKASAIKDDKEVEQGVANLLDARKALTDGLQGIAEDLKKAGLIASADPEKVPQGVKAALELAKASDPKGEIRKQRAEIDRLKGAVTAARKKADEEIAAARAALKDRWTPAQMLPAWLPVLEAAPTDKTLADRAAHDAEQVLADAKASAAEKARAHVILGLARRNAGQFAQAKEELGKGAKALAEDKAWQARAEAALRDVSDPVGAILRKADRLTAEGKQAEALELLNRGVQALPADQQLNLRVRRGLVALEAAASGSAKPDEKLAAQIRQDAKAAQDAGQPVGHYAAGRLAEQLGRFGEAVRQYEAAVKAHPDLDEEGLLYRAALARVLLRRGERGAVRAPAAVPTDRRARKAAALEAVVLLTALALPPGGAGSMTEDERRARELADEILAAGDKVPFNLRAQALAIKGLHTRAVMTYAEGLRAHLPPALANGLLTILQSHPALRRPEGTDAPDPVEADKHYAEGLNRYFAEDYPGAEKELAEAVRLYGRDARYFYFLGLARLHQGKRGAAADFVQGARLEALDLPPQAAVSRSLERIQGRVRLLLNEAREQR